MVITEYISVFCSDPLVALSQCFQCNAGNEIQRTKKNQIKPNTAIAKEAKKNTRTERYVPWWREGKREKKQSSAHGNILLLCSAHQQPDTPKDLMCCCFFFFCSFVQSVSILSSSEHREEEETERDVKQLSLNQIREQQKHLSMDYVKNESNSMKKNKNIFSTKFPCHVPEGQKIEVPRKNCVYLTDNEEMSAKNTHTQTQYDLK